MYDYKFLYIENYNKKQYINSNFLKWNGDNGRVVKGKNKSLINKMIPLANLYNPYPLYASSSGQLI